MIWVLYLVGLILIGCSDQPLVGEDALTSAPTPTEVASVVILEPTPAGEITPTSAPALDITPTSAPAGEITPTSTLVVDITPTSTPDGDGWSVAEGDCDDLNWLIHPDAPEVCDGVDQNCNGQMDEGITSYLFENADGDKAPAYKAPVEVGCSVQAQPGYMTTGSWPLAEDWDCDDNNPEILGEPCPNL